jgi:hypothetical protein
MMDESPPLFLFPDAPKQPRNIHLLLGDRRKRREPGGARDVKMIVFCLKEIKGLTLVRETPQRTTGSPA